MISKLVALALRMPGMVLALATGLIVVGIYAYDVLDIEAYPNPVPPLVEVITQPNGWSAEETERYITVPLEIGLAGMPGLTHRRSQSLFGLSDIKCYFDWNTKYENARQEVINRLQFVPLPNGNQATISPWNAIGEVYRYTLEGKGYTLSELKEAEDWIMERQWKQVPGVIDVTSYGGLSKQYQINVDPFRLRGHAVTLQQLSTAVTNANTNVGGQRLTMGEQSFDVRGIGLLGGGVALGNSVHDIEDVVIVEQKGVPVRVRDVASVDVGFAPRLGMVGKDNDNDVVQGIVLMRYGGETPTTLKGVHERLEHIKAAKVLPPGMEIKSYYDRGDLVEVTVHTVLENVVTGIVLVSLTLLLFLGNWRAALITALNIPLALLCAFCGLVGTGTSANLISLGAVDFGIVVDSTVIMVENIFRHLGNHGKGTMRQRIQAAAKEVGTPMSFSTLIIGIAFLPLFTLTGVPGAIFAPMARTYAFAIGGAIILALTLTPVLAKRFIPKDTEEKENFLMHFLHRVYNPLFDAALGSPKVAVALCTIPIIACVVLFPLLGSEFMPKLEEGNFWVRATFPMSISLDQSSSYVGRMRDILRGCPKDKAVVCTDENRKHKEVITVVSQLGRPDDGTDVTGFFNMEFFAPLKPFDKWEKGLTKEKLTDELQAELSDEFPGAIFGFSQAISDNVEEAVAGVKGENSVKVFGPDLEENERIAGDIVKTMEKVRGVKDLGVFHSLGQPNVKITPDRRACARYGLNTGDLMAVVQAAVGGQSVTQVYEGEKMFDLAIRWQPEYRQSLEAISEITVATPDGNNIPLAQLANIQEVTGPATVYREDGSRYAPVKFSVRGRDLASTILEAQQRIEKEVKRPYNTHLEWEGEMKELQSTMQRLAFILPLTLILISFLVFTAVKNWIDTVIVIVDIPVACTGGVLALLIARMNFSVSAAMGFVSVFGIAVQDALLMVSYFQQLRAGGMSIEMSAREASEKRFRPVLMTTLVATLGLTPAALSHGIGSESQKPLAIVVIGGSLVLAILTRLMQPPLMVVAHRWREARLARLNAEGKGKAATADEEEEADDPDVQSIKHPHEEPKGHA
jgi:cobalt-zinc-cadmium resistance protein CzcA